MRKVEIRLSSQPNLIKFKSVSYTWTLAIARRRLHL